MNLTNFTELTAAPKAQLSDGNLNIVTEVSNTNHLFLTISLGMCTLFSTCNDKFFAFRQFCHEAFARIWLHRGPTSNLVGGPKTPYAQAGSRVNNAYFDTR